MAVTNDIIDRGLKASRTITEASQPKNVLAAFPGFRDREEGMPNAAKDTSGVSGVDYGDVLRSYGLEPNRMEFHWQVGRLGLTQGWLLHLSIVRSQILAAIGELIPFLVSTGAPFRIVQDYETAIRVLDGNLGRDQLGKVITVYPTSDEAAFQIAGELIRLTASYKGPVILTDIHLGNCVYTRYGAFAAIMRSDAEGHLQKFIYTHNGDLVPDIEKIPFALPEGRSWPFERFASAIPPGKKDILHDRYKALEYFKNDPRGDVFKAYYLRKFFLINACLIKQGIRDMWSDDYGRDMGDRLFWQWDLYDKLKHIVPLPRIFDYFKENGDSYLAMELIKGDSLFDYITKKTNPNCEWFHNWAMEDQLNAVDFLIEICSIVQSFHDHGFINRDVTPVNFMVEKKSLWKRLIEQPFKRNAKNRLKVIDIELAYPLWDGQPWRPYTFGTFGFMSPQQAGAMPPSVKDDTYGLAATILTTLTGIPPLAFDSADYERLETNLQFFIMDRDLVRAICSGLSFSPDLRPTATDMGGALKVFRERLERRIDRISKYSAPEIKDARIREIIEAALKGLVSEPTVISKGIWQTRSKDAMDGGKPNVGYFKSGGFYDGISGPLYITAKAKIVGIDISICQETYDQNWDFLYRHYLREVPHLPPGLSGGSAGMAIAIAKGMEAGLLSINEENTQLLRSCLEVPSAGIDHYSGAAGQGIAALKCASLLEPAFCKEYLSAKAAIFLNAQDQGGSWFMLKTGKKKPESAILFENGNTGILCFLLEYHSVYPDTIVLAAIQKALNACRTIFASIQRRYRKVGYRGHLKDVQLYDGYMGLIKVFLKAYEILKVIDYRECAEFLLNQYPVNVVHEDLGLQYGLSGMGSIYLKAYELTGNNKWKSRALWIAEALINLAQRNERGSLYWLSNNQTLPVAELMAGNSGIIDFFITILSNSSLVITLIDRPLLD